MLHVHSANLHGAAGREAGGDLLHKQQAPEEQEAALAEGTALAGEAYKIVAPRRSARHEGKPTKDYRDKEDAVGDFADALHRKATIHGPRSCSYPICYDNQINTRHHVFIQEHRHHPYYSKNPP